MRSFATVIVILCVAGAALARDESPLVFVPTWDVEPRPAEIVAHYPPRALAQNVSGIAVMCCTPRADRSIDCATSSEWPSGFEFGAASVRASLGYRLSEASYGDLHARADRPVRLSMLWAGPILTAEMQQQLLQLDRDTAYACLPPEHPTN
ncbi:MAG: hypothetical protein H7124_10220 [Phycisphaerales bacterium]|nr:hypothetical protein [Hyphomonadaceae bacterium]